MRSTIYGIVVSIWHNALRHLVCEQLLLYMMEQVRKTEQGFNFLLQEYHWKWPVFYRIVQRLTNGLAGLLVYSEVKSKQMLHTLQKYPWRWPTKSDRNMPENQQTNKQCRATSWYWSLVNKKECKSLYHNNRSFTQQMCHLNFIVPSSSQPHKRPILKPEFSTHFLFHNPNLLHYTTLKILSDL